MIARTFALAMVLIAAFAGCGSNIATAQSTKPISPKKFDALATKALDAMKKRAAELRITGVAVVSWAPGDGVQGWTSKMAVVGRMKDPTSATEKGDNLIGIAYAKSAEMADTLQDSGTAKRPPMTGEFGWQGGVIAQTSSGHAIVAFSGGKSEDDVEVSKAGLAVLKRGL